VYRILKLKSIDIGLVELMLNCPFAGGGLDDFFGSEDPLVFFADNEFYDIPKRVDKTEFKFIISSLSVYKYRGCELSKSVTFSKISNFCFFNLVWLRSLGDHL